MSASLTDDGTTRPSERIREAFLSQMEGTGLKCDKVIGTEIYEVSGEKNGLIYLKVRSRGKPFFGIRHEFSKILLGDAPGNITEVEKNT